MVLKLLKPFHLPKHNFPLFDKDTNDAIDTTGVVVDDGNYDNGTFKDRDYDVRKYKSVAINIQNIGANAIKYKVQSTTKDFVDFDADISDDDFDKEEKAETSLAAGAQATGSVEVTGGPSVKAEGDLTPSSAVANTFGDGTATLVSVTGEVHADGDVICASVEVGDSVTFNGLEYTAISGSKAGDNTKFDISGTNDQAATDLADSITNDVRAGTLDDLTATSSTDTVTAVQTVGGAGGNATTLVSSDGTRLAVSGATFANGITGDTFTANGNKYTATVGARADDTEFSVDTGDNETATDLAAAINADTRSGTLGDLSASATTNVVTVTTDVLGVAGNAVTLAETGTTITISAGTLTGGVDADFVIVNGNRYDAIAGSKAGDNTKFSIDTGNNETATDLADSITNDTRPPVTVPGIDVTATASTNVVTVEAPVNDGADGNAIDTTASSNITAEAATLENGVSSSIEGITVDGQEIMDGTPVKFRTSSTLTADDIATNINGITTNPNYTAVNVTGTITITAAVNEPSTATVTASNTVLTTTDVNMSGGAGGKADSLAIQRLTPEITALRIRAKESSAGNPGTLRLDIKASEK